MTRVPKGYLIGRATVPVGKEREQLWECIATVADYADAVHQAQTIARIEGVRAWLRKTVDVYDRLWPARRRAD